MKGIYLYLFFFVYSSFRTRFFSKLVPKVRLTICNFFFLHTIVTLTNKEKLNFKRDFFPLVERIFEISIHRITVDRRLFFFF